MHRITSTGRNPRDAPDWLGAPAGPLRDAALELRIREAFACLAHGGTPPSLSTEDFDRRFFGLALRAPIIGPRIAAVVERIKADPTGALAARRCAQEAGLSESRFLHVFSDEVGTSFRKFKAWKRARSFLHHVTSDVRLTDLALDTGYPDATHFSHSIRQAFGLTPSSIVAGSRRLAVYAHP